MSATEMQRAAAPTKLPPAERSGYGTRNWRGAPRSAAKTASVNEDRCALQCGEASVESGRHRGGDGPRREPELLE